MSSDTLLFPPHAFTPICLRTWMTSLFIKICDTDFSLRHFQRTHYINFVTNQGEDKGFVRLLLLLFPVALRAMASSFLRFRDHKQRRIIVGRTPLEGVISSSQRPLPDNTQQSNAHAPGGIRTHDRSRRAAADLRLRSRGYWDRLSFVYFDST